MTWVKEISEGTHVGATTHQGAPGRGGTPWCLVVSRCTPPLMLFAPEILKYSEKIRIKFSEHSENFYFWVIFYCTENSGNRQGMAFYFI